LLLRFEPWFRTELNVSYRDWRIHSTGQRQTVALFMRMTGKSPLTSHLTLPINLAEFRFGLMVF
jgi:hypothetical protein